MEASVLSSLCFFSKMSNIMQCSCSITVERNDNDSRERGDNSRCKASECIRENGIYLASAWVMDTLPEEQLLLVYCSREEDSIYEDRCKPSAKIKR